jgi:GxxExxY protein
MIMTENEIATKVIGFSLEIHRALGSGLREGAYQECLFYKLNAEGLYTEKEKPMPILFEGQNIHRGYRIDLLVENKVVIELKSVKDLNNVHLAQTLNYLKLGGFKLGLLMNFNVALLKNGIRRVIN